MCERQETPEYGDAFGERRDGTPWEEGDHFAVSQSGPTAATAGRETAPGRPVLPLWLTQGEAEMLVDLCCLAPVAGTAAEQALFGKIGEMLRDFYHRGGTRSPGVGPRERESDYHTARVPASL